MKAEDVPPPWTDAARSAYEDAWEQGHPPYRSMMHAITAVAPLIAKAERERCAAVVENYEPARVISDGGGREDESVWLASENIAAAIRALPDA